MSTTVTSHKKFPLYGRAGRFGPHSKTPEMAQRITEKEQTHRLFVLKNDGTLQTRFVGFLLLSLYFHF